MDDAAAVRAAYTRYQAAGVAERWQMWTPADQAQRPLALHRAIMAAVPEGVLGPRPAIEGIVVDGDRAWVTTRVGVTALQRVDASWRICAGIGQPVDVATFVEHLRPIEFMRVAEAGAPVADTWSARIALTGVPVLLERARAFQPPFFLGAALTGPAAVFSVSARGRFFVQNAVRLGGRLAVVRAGEVLAAGPLAGALTDDLLRVPLVHPQVAERMTDALDQMQIWQT